MGPFARLSVTPGGCRGDKRDDQQRSHRAYRSPEVAFGQVALIRPYENWPVKVRASRVGARRPDGSLRAQGFSDGTLAVVRGAELQFVATDGWVKQSFRAEESPVTYSAIEASGVVWVASEKASYVAR
jgi:hypothetical protein